MSKIILIGQCKRQGKDTFANFLCLKLNQNNKTCIILHHSEPIKEIISEALGLTKETLELLKNENSYYRDILQRFGNGKMKKYFSKNVWQKIILKKANEFKHFDYIVIPSFRFLEDYIENSITIKVVKDKEICNDESNLVNFNYDFIVYNNKKIEDLMTQANLIVNQIINL